MNFKIGSDIVYVPRFKKAFLENRGHFLSNIFLPAEFKTDSHEHLAGIFAAKEATIKALGIKSGQWLEIEVRCKKTGKPYLRKFPLSKHFKHDLTISHDGEYAIAFTIFYPRAKSS